MSISTVNVSKVQTGIHSPELRPRQVRINFKSADTHVTPCYLVELFEVFNKTMADLNFLEVPPNAITEIKKKYNLDSTERMDEAVSLLQDWINKQEHFVKKNFTRHYFETALITSKGSVERAKQRLEKLFTLRTLLPDFFQVINVRELTCLDHLVGGILPKLDNEYNRVFILKTLENCFVPQMYTNFYKKNIIMAEYIRHHDFCDGFVIVFDNTDINVMDLLTGFNLLETRNILKLLMEGYGMRMRGMHIVLPNTTSTTVYELLLRFTKSVLSNKLASRLFMHSSIDELYKHIPREILPLDYGGNEMSLADLTEKWKEVLGSDEHMRLMKEINQAKIDEKFKQYDKYYEEYFGLSGSFRKLEVD